MCTSSRPAQTWHRPPLTQTQTTTMLQLLWQSPVVRQSSTTSDYRQVPRKAQLFALLRHLSRATWLH
jgi:hypothetical protein